jgi:hypothetical protein
MGRRRGNERTRLRAVFLFGLVAPLPACGISTNERSLHRYRSVCVLGTRAISHAQSLEPNRVINRDRCRDGRLALALVQGSGTSSRILTAPHLSKVNPLSFARSLLLSPPGCAWVLVVGGSATCVVWESWCRAPRSAAVRHPLRILPPAYVA